MTQWLKWSLHAHLVINSTNIYGDPTILDTGDIIVRNKNKYIKKEDKLLYHLQSQQEMHSLSKEGEREGYNLKTLQRCEQVLRKSAKDSAIPQI